MSQGKKKGNHLVEKRADNLWVSHRRKTKSKNIDIYWTLLIIGEKQTKTTSWDAWVCSR